MDARSLKALAQELEAMQEEKQVDCSPVIVDIADRIASYAVSLNSMGVNVVVSVEPSAKDIAIILNYIVACGNNASLTVTHEGMTKNVVFTIPVQGNNAFSLPPPKGPRQFLIATLPVFDTPHASVDDAISMMTGQFASEYDFTIFVTNVARNFRALHVEYGVIARAINESLKASGEEWRLKYFDRVPLVVLLTRGPEEVKRVAQTTVPPPPPFSTYLEKDVEKLDMLLMPREMRRILDVVLEANRYSSDKAWLLLIGPVGAGKRTIAYALARELGYPAYQLDVTNILGRWVGVSEANARSLVAALKERRDILVYVSGLDSFFGKNVDSDSTSSTISSVKRIFESELPKARNVFLVTGVSENAPESFITNPSLANVKLVVPLPRRAEREVLVRRFLQPYKMYIVRAARAIKRINNIPQEQAASLVEKKLIHELTKRTAGMVPGEIMKATRIVTIGVAREVEQRGLKALPTIEEYMSYLSLDESTVMARIESLQNVARLVGSEWVIGMLSEVSSELHQ